MIDPGRSRISFAESFCGIESLYYFFDLLGSQFTFNDLFSDYIFVSQKPITIDKKRHFSVSYLTNMTFLISLQIHLETFFFCLQLASIDVNFVKAITMAQISNFQEFI